MSSERQQTTASHDHRRATSVGIDDVPHHRLRRVGVELLAGAAAMFGIVLALRRRGRRHALGSATADAATVDPRPRARTDEPDERPGVIHAPGHRHRLHDEPPEPPPHRDDHPPPSPPRHRDRGGRSTAFRSRRST